MSLKKAFTAAAGIFTVAGGLFAAATPAAAQTGLRATAQANTQASSQQALAKFLDGQINLKTGAINDTLFRSLNTLGTQLGMDSDVLNMRAKLSTLWTISNNELGQNWDGKLTSLSGQAQAQWNRKVFEAFDFGIADLKENKGFSRAIQQPGMESVRNLTRGLDQYRNGVAPAAQPGPGLQPFSNLGNLPLVIGASGKPAVNPAAAPVVHAAPATKSAAQPHFKKPSTPTPTQAAGGIQPTQAQYKGAIFNTHERDVFLFVGQALSRLMPDHEHRSRVSKVTGSIGNYTGQRIHDGDVASGTRWMHPTLKNPRDAYAAYTAGNQACLWRTSPVYSAAYQKALNEVSARFPDTKSVMAQIESDGQKAASYTKLTRAQRHAMDCN
ncbi:MAG: hypothetical protein H6865_00975 [Rhodospirillales bacterium]|nr:hypothetical protein [Alphaproteobacteria bacterium]MCB9986199.1 hypothetical protein [Rhodospirillales bacterium]USO07244.1 MAG: hypothetical protein H6866_07395 [Rhodospirillales bacterium]